jgi:hypothetical protein
MNYMGTTANSPNELRRCHHCNARLPLSAFGLFKPDPSGYAKICKECRSEMNQTRWTKKYGRKRPVDPKIIRGVRWQNSQILDMCLSTSKIELRGFDTSTKAEYKVFYGPSERVGLMAMTLFNRSGTVFMEWALSGVKDPKEALLHYLKAHEIRLELSDMDVINSKTLIYFL